MKYLLISHLQYIILNTLYYIIYIKGKNSSNHIIRKKYPIKFQTKLLNYNLIILNFNYTLIIIYFNYIILQL